MLNTPGVVVYVTTDARFVSDPCNHRILGKHLNSDLSRYKYNHCRNIVLNILFVVVLNYIKIIQNRCTFVLALFGYLQLHYASNTFTMMHGK